VAERIARCGEVEIAYEELGRPGDPALLLIMGLGTQMLAWGEELCRMLADRGFRVVRFDNRDAGRSTRITGGPRPDVAAALAGDASSASYTLSEMAADTVGLMDALGIGAAHLVGASQGGMIAQTVAIEHPRRVLSLVSIMSTTGERSVGRPRPEALGVLLRSPPADAEGFAEAAVEAFRAIGSRAFGDETGRVRKLALESFKRGGHDPDAVARQLLAILASGDRTEALHAVRVPTLVIHGTEDPLVDVSGGRATAAAIPGARLELIEGMGHDLPRALWPRLADLIAENAARATPA